MNWIGVSAINMAAAVSLGAFGSHGLKNIASPEQLAWWHTGTLYLFFHALGLLAVSILIYTNTIIQSNKSNSSLDKGLNAKGLTIVAWLLQIGVIIFSGSLFAMALNAPRWLGAITPIGGTLMIVGWLWLAWVAFKSK